jgi:hypothetical protein
MFYLQATYSGNLKVLHEGPKKASIAIFNHFFLNVTFLSFWSPTVLVLIRIRTHEIVWFHIESGFSESVLDLQH